MTNGNTYHVSAPRHYAPYLLDGEVGPSWKVAGVRAFERHLSNQGRVIFGMGDRDTDEANYWATYLALGD